MNAELKKLYDAKGKAVTQMEAVGERLKKGEKLTAEEEKQFDGWDAELIAANASIERLEKVEALEKEKAIAELKGKKGSEEPDNKKEKPSFNYAEGKRAWAKASTGGKLTESEKKIFDHISEQEESFRRFINLGPDSLSDNERARVEELRANAQAFERSEGQRAQTVTTSGGGYTIPQGFLADIVQAMKMVSPFFTEAKIGASDVARSLFYWLDTATGNDLPMPTVDDTGTTGELLAINTDAFGSTADLAFGQITMKAYKYNAKPMKVPSELLQDTGLDLAALISETLGTRNGRIINTQFTLGDNSGKPQGIVPGSTLGVVSAADNAIAFNDILDLEHAVDPSYRKSPFARFMFNDSTLKYLKKLTIGTTTYNSRPLWQPSYVVGAPDTIDGVQYLINQDMVGVTDAGRCMIFGDMKQYAIRQAGPPVLKFLGERFADADQVAWVLFQRMDGRYRNTAAIKYLEVS